MSKHRVDTASILRRCRGAYRAQSEFLAEAKANLARITIEIRVQYGRMVGPGGGIACRGVVVICGWLVDRLVDGVCMLPSASHRRALIRAVRARPEPTVQPRASSLLHQPLMPPTELCFLRVPSLPCPYDRVPTQSPYQYGPYTTHPPYSLNTACRDRHAKARAPLVLMI